MSFCDSPADYAAALVELETSRSDSQSLALAVTDGPLVRRVRRVLGMPAEDESRGMGVVVSVAMTAIMLVGAAAGEGRFWPWSTTESGRITVAVQAAAQNEPLASPASFDWRVVNTDHFEIHYYPTVDEDLQQVGDTAEEAYVWLSANLSTNCRFACR